MKKLGRKFFKNQYIMSNPKNKPLSQIELQGFGLSDSKLKDLVYDFSRINNKFFPPIIAAIKQYGIQHLSSLSFSLDMYYQSYKSEFPTVRPDKARVVIRSSKPKMEPTVLAESCYRKLPKAIDSLLLALEYVLKNTSTLETLTFRSFLLTKPQIEKLSQILEQNSTIKKLRFDNVTLFDEGFSVVIRSLHHQGLKSFHCTNCGLTDNSIPDVKSFLLFHVSLQREAEWRASLELDGIVSTICLTTLDLQHNLFSVRCLMEIADVLADMPLTLLDIRYNQPMDDRIVFNIRKSIPHVAIRINDATLKRKTQKKKRRNSHININDNDYNNEDENIRGSEQVASAEDNVFQMPMFNFLAAPSANSLGSSRTEEIKLARGVTVVGKRASEFSQYIQDLCNFAEQIMNNTHYIPKVTKKPKKRARSVSRRRIRKY